MSITDEPRTKSQDVLEPPPQPIDDDKKKDSNKIAGAVGIVAVLAVIVGAIMLTRGDAEVNSAKDIATVYDHAIILQAREGDTLETAALAVFPNTLIEERVREDKLDDEAKALELARYQAEWQRLARLLTGTTGTTLTAGEFFAVPAKADEPGAIEVGQVPTEIKELTEASERLDDATGG